MITWSRRFADKDRNVIIFEKRFHVRTGANEVVISFYVSQLQFFRITGFSPYSRLPIWMLGPNILYCLHDNGHEKVFDYLFLRVLRVAVLLYLTPLPPPSLILLLLLFLLLLLLFALMFPKGKTNTQLSVFENQQYIYTTIAQPRTNSELNRRLACTISNAKRLIKNERDLRWLRNLCYIHRVSVIMILSFNPICTFKF